MAAVLGRDLPRSTRMSFEYHDLSVETSPGPYVVGEEAFAPVELCPRHCSHWVIRTVNGRARPICAESGVGFDKPRPASQLSSIQNPRFRVVITDVDGSLITRYYDDAWRLLREISHDTSTRSDYNYKGASLSAIRHEDQHRTCIDSDEFNRPLYLTRIAAAGHPGIQVEETAFTYDEAGAASSIVQDPSSTEPGGRLYLRDSFERIV